jgi:hypothetical protein
MGKILKFIENILHSKDISKWMSNTSTINNSNEKKSEFNKMVRNPLKCSGSRRFKAYSAIGVLFVLNLLNYIDRYTLAGLC